MYTFFRDRLSNKRNTPETRVLYKSKRRHDSKLSLLQVTVVMFIDKKRCTNKEIAHITDE